jgi:2-amino-4-hydroxy-6-hydroxymethyldihydropteridine diphosphokinase
MEQVLIGLGANLGRPERQLALAVRALGRVVALDRVSSLYRTAPVGDPDQPDFLNLVVCGTTPLEPPELLAALHRIERRFGRRRHRPDAPRTLDLDLLDHGGRTLRTPELELPHPRLHLRGFVLVPLAEVAPEWRHPVLRRTASELLADAAPVERVERWATTHPFPSPLAGDGAPE